MAKRSQLASQSSSPTTNSDEIATLSNGVTRRSFLQGIGVAGVALSTGALLGAQAADESGSGALTSGDAAILRFLAAAEILETDLWQQYNELGGIQDSEVPGGT